MSAGAICDASESHLYQIRRLRPDSPETIATALGKDAVARRILAKGEMPVAGQLVGVRLNINVLKTTGIAVHSIHRATSLDGHTKLRGFYKGEVINYLPVVELKDAYFNVHQNEREGIASGLKAKSPMASIDGAFIGMSLNANFDGIELRFDPKKMHLFADLEGFAVHYAENVTVLGHRAYARGKIRYHTLLSAPTKVGSSPTLARLKESSEA
jgi:hypothetical protein